jgi:hypothetical protein
MAQNVELAIWEKPDIPPDCDVVTLKVRNISPDDGALLHEVEPVITMPHKPSDTKQPNWSSRSVTQRFSLSLEQGRAPALLAP